MIQVFRVVL